MAWLHIKPVFPHGVSFSLDLDWWYLSTEAVISNTTLTAYCLAEHLLAC